MRLIFVVLFVVVINAVFAQSDRGTITGTIADPAGAVVANAPIEARNVGTGAVYPVASTATGNYTLTQLPAGNYEISVTVPGFKKYTRQGLTVQAAQTMRIDIALEVGSASESVTVVEATPLLKTESGELSHVVATERLDSLPLMQTGAVAGSSGIRNPYNVVALMPGSYYSPTGSVGPTVRINGGVSNSETVLIEGMDATNSLGQGASQQNQPGADSIQEWAVQTSNYAAEFGQAGNAIMNVTMRSGTNQIHGSAYEYYANEAFNAGQPFTNDGNGHLVRTQQRRNDYGFTVGGPVRIPKVYDGRNKTFFFFNWEQYLISQNMLPAAISVPTADYRLGNFSAAKLKTVLGTDPLGNSIFGNEVYDPSTRQTVKGQIVTSPFLNNTIPPTSFDSVAKKVQALIPSPTNPSLLVNNYQQTYLSDRHTEVPSVKIDQAIGSKDKLSFFWNRTVTRCLYCAGALGLPQPIDGDIGTFIHAHSERLNWDHTLSPTLLLHLGAGWSQNDLGQPAATPDFDACGQLGLCGPFDRPATFPVLAGLTNATSGGVATLGQGSHSDSIFEQSSGIASLTWVKNNHTFKFGGELRNQGDLAVSRSNLNGTYTFSQAQTALPYVVQASPTANLAGNTIGFPYASFLLGLVNNAELHPSSDARLGKEQWGFFAQDNWKITRKLTLDIGLRYDYSTRFKEQYGRSPDFSANVANPSAGGHPGAVIYEATCNCNFGKNYPLAFGPRFGAAYQLAPKTVLRAGFGIAYTGTPQYNLGGGAISATNPIGPSPNAGLPIMTLSTGVPLTAQQIAWPNFDVGRYPVLNAPFGAGPAQTYDQNSGRPARQYQWSIGVQREIVRNLVVEASYVANRGIWWTNNTLVNYNYLSTALLSSYGLSLNNPSDLTILNATLSSPAAGRFQNKLPYSGFPVTSTVAQSLRPFPQFNSGLTGLASPLGNSWYDSLQLKVTKRYSHGLDFTYAFTWAKQLDNFGGTPDIQNRGLSKGLSTLDQPFVSGIGVNYTLQPWGKNRVLSFAVRDWQFGGFLQYASGTPLAVPLVSSSPTLATLTFQSATTQVQNRVPGVPLFTQDLNCHCFDPNTTFVLNPAAWTNPAPGQFGSATLYNDYRSQRRPVENLALGRLFRIRENVSLSMRIEFTNVFNRTEFNSPTLAALTNPQAAQTRSATGQTTAGFGFINNTTVAVNPRQGQVVAKIQF
jgi:hypothetical protein